MTQQLLVRATTVLVVIALTSSCSAPRQSDETHHTAAAELPLIAEPELDRKTGQIRLPLDSILPTDQQRVLLLNAQDVVLSKCMRENGETFPALKRASTQLPSRRYGVWTRSQATTYGYTVPEESLSDEASLSNSKKMSEGAESALTKCALSDDFSALRPAGVDLVQRDAGAIFDEAFNGDDGRKVFSEWAACMENEGYVVGSKDHPLTPDGHVGKKSQNAALTDVKCKNSTKFVEKMADLETRIQNQYIEKHVSDLADIKNGVRASVDRAQAVMSQRR